MKLDTERDCTFDGLVEALSAAHGEMHGRATSAVNRALTLRNWLMGAFIQEYELRGRDRAEYGERLFIRLAERLAALRVPRADARELHRYVAFYLSYPQIRETVSPESLALWPSVRIGETASPDSPADGCSQSCRTRWANDRRTQAVPADEGLGRAVVGGGAGGVG